MKARPRPIASGDRTLNPSNPRNVLETPDVAEPQPERQWQKDLKKQQRTRDKAGKAHGGTTQQSRFAAKVMNTPEVFQRLAEAFVSQPWVHTYRGDQHPLPQIRIAQSHDILAVILRERVQADRAMDGRSHDRIEEIVDYAMKHFFDRVPNEERSSAGLIRRFTHEDWWDELIPESIDHFKMLRTPMPPWEESQQAVEAYYANWPKKQTSNRPKTVKEAAARFNEIYAKYQADQEAEYALLDEEPLT